MNKLNAINAPFNLNHSSCYSHKPKLFEWTGGPEYPTVVMDRAITHPNNCNGIPDKYAWICESRTICWQDNILQHQEIYSSYKKIFLADKTKLHLGPNLVYCPAGSNLPWLPILDEPPLKNKMCSMIASPKARTCGHKYRHQIARKYMNQLDLIGGSCGSPRFGFGHQATAHPDKSSFTVPYRFQVVIENDSYPDYYTEKITDCFASWTVPIYWGCPSIGDYFNMDGIINLTDGNLGIAPPEGPSGPVDFDISSLTEELYIKMLPAIEENNKIIQQLQMSDDTLYTNIMNEER